VSILCDSDILIEISRERDLLLLERWLQLGRSDTPLLCSPVTVAEVWAGARPSEEQTIESLFAIFVCVPIDARIARQAGNFIKKYRKSHSLGLGDSLIAATAVSHGATLWTRNRKHYPMTEVTFY